MTIREVKSSKFVTSLPVVRRKSVNIFCPLHNKFWDTLGINRMLSKALTLETKGDFFQAFKCEGNKRYLQNTSSKLDISIFNTIDEVVGNDWNKLVPESSLLMQYAYLRAVELSSPAHEQSKYAIIYKKDKEVACAIFRIVTLTGKDYRSEDEKCIPIKKLKNSIKEKTKLRVLVCGHTHISGDHGFIYSSSIASRDAYHALSDACNKIIHEQGNIDLCLIKDFYEQEFEASVYLQKFKYRQFKVDPNMLLRVRPEWHSFEDYLNALSSKYRKKALQAVKQGAILQRRIFNANEIAENFDKIQLLYLNVVNKAKVQFNKFDISYLMQLKLLLKDDFEFTAYYLNDELVAFNTMIFWGDNCEAHAIGLNYDFNIKYALYQNFLYDDVRRAIEKNKGKLILGRTAMEMKSNVGAEPYEMCCYVKHTDTFLNAAMKPVFGYIKQTEWIQRRPFKEVTAAEREDEGCI